jgi:SAM-dependent methyltransferase
VTMLSFDSDEYWLVHQWDRDQALRDAHPCVASVLLEQERLTLRAVENLLQSRNTRFEGPFRILDLGCGTGRISRLLAEHLGAKVSITLADINPMTLSREAMRLPTASLEGSACVHVYNVGNVWSQEFDLVLCMEIFHHIADLDLAFRSIARSLSPGGFLIGNVFLPGGYRTFDKKKHGRLGSLRRRTLHALGLNLHRLPMPYLAGLVLRRGWSRIAPVESGHFLGLMAGSFNISLQDENVYLWFQATVR